jgi:hypothetical protein
MAAIQGDHSVKALKQHWPLAAALAALYAVIVRWLILSLDRQGGRLVYALDDPYIHLAIAKNLAREGVWGITRDGFSAASSSPLWTLLLAAIDTLVGVNAIAPLLLNLLFASLTLAVIYMLFRRYSLHPLFSLGALLAITFLTPLPTLIFGGQEHVLHLLLTVLFAALAVQVMASGRAAPRPSGRTRGVAVCLLAAALPLVRYEALFLIFVASILWLLRGQWPWALPCSELAVLPVAIYGGLAKASGGFWLPNPVILKSSLATALTLDGAVDRTLRLFSLQSLKGFYWWLFGSSALHVTVLILAALVLVTVRAARRSPAADERALMLVLFAGTAFLHLRLASVGWFYRYEAYLMGWGLTSLAIGMGDLLPRRLEIRPTNPALARVAAGGGVLIVLAYPAVERGWNAYQQTLPAMWSIYAQQVQMGLFIHTYYDGEGVALNDVGAASYLSSAHILDLWGLGSNEVARTRHNSAYNTAAIDDLVYERGVKIAILYTYWFEPFGGLPDWWVKIGEWTVPNAVAVAYPTVTFYATDLTEINPLAVHLYEFSPRLPPGVIQRLYVEPIFSRR